MATDRVLLDTTVQLWRIAYGPEEAERFSAELRDKEEVYTTSFVFREFLNTIIADLEYVHIQASSILTPDEDGRVGMDRLARFLATGKGNYSSRSIQRIYLIIGKLLESFENTKVPKIKLLLRIERTAGRWMRDFFRYSSGSSVGRSITCLTGLDDEPQELERMRASRPFPPQPQFPRAVADFLDRSRAHVENVEAQMRKATKKQGRDDKLLKALGWLKGKDGNYLFTEKLRTYKAWNWALGDLLIALETPDDVAVYSTDRAFTILCRALGKRCYRGHRAPA